MGSTVVRRPRQAAIATQAAEATDTATAPPAPRAHASAASGSRWAGPVRAARLASDVVVGGPQVLAALLAAPLARRRYARWGATDDEVAAELPGDDLVPRPRLGYTRAITVDAPPEVVWDWLVQIGQGRGGLYSYDGLENLVGCRIRSADRLLPEHSRLAVDDLVRLGPEGYPCFRVRQVTAPSTLVLLGAEPRPPHAVPEPGSPTGAATWQWSLREDGPRRTRLLVRQRLAFPDEQRLLWHLVEPIAFVMERRMLRGLRRRAESADRVPARRTRTS